MAARKVRFSLAAVLIGFLILEVGLRAVTSEVGRWSVHDQRVIDHVSGDHMRYHSSLGWVRGDLPNPGLGLNSAGFRHPDVARDKPAGGWRAFALGDSQTFGAGVEAEDAWPSQAEALLQKRMPSASIELINAGISGYTSLQVLRLVDSVLLDWHPDALIIDCRTRDSLRDEGLEAELGHDLLNRVTFHWRTLWVLRTAIERVRPGRPRSMHLHDMSRDDPQLPVDFGNHGLIVDLAAREDLEVLFVDYPFWESGGIGCLAPTAELPDGAVVAPACAALQATGLPAERLFLDNNHLTVEGNRRVAEAVVSAVLVQGWLEEQSGHSASQ